MSRFRLTAALLAASLVLVGCGGSDKDSSPSKDDKPAAPSAAAATGERQSTTDFSFNAPSGWKKNSGAAMPSVNFEVLAVDPTDKDGFADNVNVLSEPQIAKYKDLDERAAAAKKGLAGLKTEDLVVEDPVTIDGEGAASISAIASQGSVTYAIIQYYVAHGEKGYVVTFSFSEDRPAAERKKIAASVAASWRWADGNAGA